MDKSDWIWMPHPGHLIIARSCNFRLNTCVGNYIVSTMGEYLYPHNATKFTEVGCDRLYETMVFPAMESDHKCCPKVPAAYSEIDFKGYNDPVEAYQGHLAMCEKWSGKD